MALLFTGGYQGNVFINSNEMDTDAADTHRPLSSSRSPVFPGRVSHSAPSLISQFSREKHGNDTCLDYTPANRGY